MNHLLSFDAVGILTNISRDRHALKHLSVDDFRALRHEILTVMNAACDGSWHLLGTDGCHLCEQAQTLIHTAAATYQLPQVVPLDLIHTTDERLIDLLGWHIPILLTDKQMLCCPFGLMDVVHASQATDMMC